MTINRRVLFGAVGSAAIITAVPSASVRAAVEIPLKYEINFELVTPWPNLFFDEEKTADGFSLEISVSDGNYPAESQPYRGDVHWWIVRDFDDDLDEAFLSGITTAKIEHCKYQGDQSFVRVNFGDHNRRSRNE